MSQLWQIYLCKNISPKYCLPSTPHCPLQPIITSLCQELYQLWPNFLASVVFVAHISACFIANQLLKKTVEMYRNIWHKAGLKKTTPLSLSLASILTIFFFSKVLFVDKISLSSNWAIQVILFILSATISWYLMRSNL